MTKKRKTDVAIPDEVVENKIYLVRGQKVMLDRDLSILYGVETKRLKEAVRRNKARFPKDFMFEMNRKEFENWRSQFASSNSEDKMGLRYAPFCFTEQGVTMLSCVLNSPRAILVNIQVIRIFTRLREMIRDTNALEIKVEKINDQLDKQGESIKLIFTYLNELIGNEKDPPPRKRIGFRQ